MTTSAEFAGRLAPAPRPVPLSLRLSNIFNAGAQLGFFLLLFSTPFFWMFAGNADLSFVTFRGATATAIATVTHVDDTAASESRQRIYANHYSFFADGKPFEGVSYSSGNSLAPLSKATVEYLDSNPQRSRLEGMRRGMFPPAVLFVLIFPFIGLVIVYFSLKAGMKSNRLFAYGVPAYGRLKDKRPTNTRINNRPVWELVFDYRARDGQTYEASTRTSMIERLTDDREEPMLYDPDAPSQAVFLDEMGRTPLLDETGALRGKGGAIFALILPSLVTFINLWWAWKRLRG